MKVAKKCGFCGREFTTSSGRQKYCSVRCADEAKKAQKKRRQDLLNAVDPVLEIQRQQYLTFSKATILMGCSRQYFFLSILVLLSIKRTATFPLPYQHSSIDR